MGNKSNTKCDIRIADVIQIILVIILGFQLLEFIGQTKLLKIQFQTENRAWITFSEFGGTKKEKCSVNYRVSGNSPANNTKIAATCERMDKLLDNNSIKEKLKIDIQNAFKIGSIYKRKIDQSRAYSTNYINSGKGNYLMFDGMVAYNDIFEIKRESFFCYKSESDSEGNFSSIAYCGFGNESL